MSCFITTICWILAVFIPLNLICHVNAWKFGTIQIIKTAQMRQWHFTKFLLVSGVVSCRVWGKREEVCNREKSFPGSISCLLVSERRKERWQIDRFGYIPAFITHDSSDRVKSGPTWFELKKRRTYVFCLFTVGIKMRLGWGFIHDKITFELW